MKIPVFKSSPVSENSGANFLTHKMIRDGSRKILFVPTIMNKIVFAIFNSLGAAALLAGLIVFIKTFNFLMLIVCGAGAVFLWLGKTYSKVYGNEKLIDLQKKTISFSRLLGLTNILETDLSFKDIYGLQIVKKDISDSDGSYFSYELNFILNDGSRTNFLDHGDSASIRQAAKAISEVIGCSVVTEGAPQS